MSPTEHKERIKSLTAKVSDAYVKSSEAACELEHAMQELERAMYAEAWSHFRDIPIGKYWDPAVRKAYLRRAKKKGGKAA